VKDYLKWPAIPLALLTAGAAPIGAPKEMYVTANSVNERLCPRADCPSTNRIYRQQRVDVYEIKDGWARVSQ
jgi:hypothetical protein